MLLQTPKLYFRGPTFKGRDVEKGGRGRGEKEREGEVPAPRILWPRTGAGRLVSADSGVVGLELSLKAVVRSHVGTQLAHVVESVGVAHSLRAHQVTARRPWRTDTHTTPTHHSHRCKEAKVAHTRLPSVGFRS